MTPQELLRSMADRLDLTEKHGFLQGDNFLVLHHPRGSGRFPFAGKGTERLSDTESGANYAVPFSRVLTYLAKAL
jgi:hypothetical protein